MPDDVFETTPGVYTYTETRFGKTAEGVLVLEKGKRNARDQRTVGSIHRGKDDDGSHLIAARYKGSGSRENLEAVHRNVNRGSYKRMENNLAELLSATTNSVHMKASSYHRPGIARPDVIMVTNTLKRNDGSTDREHRSFQNLSNQEMDAIQAKMNVTDVPIDPRQYESLTPEQIALAGQYAQQPSVEMPLGMADRFMKGECSMNMDKRATFQASLRKGAPSLSEQAAFAQAKAAQKHQSGKKASSDPGGFERGKNGCKEGGREMGGKSSKQAKAASVTSGRALGGGKGFGGRSGAGKGASIGGKSGRGAGFGGGAGRGGRGGGIGR